MNRKYLRPYDDICDKIAADILPLLPEDMNVSVGCVERNNNKKERKRFKNLESSQQHVVVNINIYDGPLNRNNKWRMINLGRYRRNNYRHRHYIYLKNY